MTVQEAQAIAEAFEKKDGPTEEEVFFYTEALDYLITETKDPRYMMQLGGYYYGIRQFDLALKYYEMAAGYDYDCAYEGLAYIWYYGRTGQRDYKKAFEYFSKIADTGNVVARYKIADMYKNGYYVEKSQEKYEEIIEHLYQDSRKWDISYLGYNNADLPFPEVDTRLARIRRDQGRTKEAIDLYLEAKTILAERISYNAFFGNLNIMKWLIDDLYELTDFDPEYFDLFDLYYLLKTPHKVFFIYDDCDFTIESVMEGEECVVNFNGKWYHNRDEFFQKAMLYGKLLVSVYDELYGFEVRG